MSLGIMSSKLRVAVYWQDSMLTSNKAVCLSHWHMSRPRTL